MAKQVMLKFTDVARDMPEKRPPDFVSGIRDGGGISRISPGPLRIDPVHPGSGVVEHSRALVGRVSLGQSLKCVIHHGV